VLAGLLAASWALLPRPAREVPGSGPAPARRRGLSVAGDLLRDRAFWIICALSFALTLVRETFNDWTVDFIKSEAGAGVSLQLASFLSLPFDVCGATGILLTGAMLGRIPANRHRWYLGANLAVLSAALLLLPRASALGLPWVVALVGIIGFCGLGPYSLLSGYFSVRLRGPASAGAISGAIDSVGYLAGVLAGSGFGWLIDRGGYRLGFGLLSGLALVSVLLVALLPDLTASSSHD